MFCVFLFIKLIIIPSNQDITVCFFIIILHLASKTLLFVFLNVFYVLAHYSLWHIVVIHYVCRLNFQYDF